MKRRFMLTIPSVYRELFVPSFVNDERESDGRGLAEFWRAVNFCGQTLTVSLTLALFSCATLSTALT
jgi:hypothetical protein